MKISIIGTGYVGLIVGLCFADFGNDVICVDSDKSKIKLLNEGNCPLYEMGAEELLRKNLYNKKISFTNDMKAAVENSEIIFIAVGTPEEDDGDANLSSFYKAIIDVCQYVNSNKVVVNKSTVPIGTAKAVRKLIDSELIRLKIDYKVDVVSNPEFLREGRAINDFLNPDRIILGSDSKRAIEALMNLYKVYKRSNKPIIITDSETAETIKYASNAFLATKITFINEIAELCEKTGANVLEVAKAMGQDGRISPKFLHPGPGYGGSCFPKDTKAIVKTAEKFDVDLSIINSVIRSNERQKRRCAVKVKNEITEGTLAILGISFKPDTDDIRESPALSIIDELYAEQKYCFKIYDPQAMAEGKRYFKDYINLSWHDNAYDAVQDSDAILIITEWNEFRSLDIEKLRLSMRGKTLFDFRNIFPKDDVEKNGLLYIGTGV